MGVARVAAEAVHLGIVHAPHGAAALGAGEGRQLAQGGFGGVGTRP